MRNLYKIPDVAFADIDFSGKGYITEEDFFNTLLIYKLKYSREELKEFFDRENSFKRRISKDKVGMNFEIFKRCFFPSEALRYENPMKRMVKAHDGHDTVNNDDEAKSKLKSLEVILKSKFEKNWVSVRKAFLDLDLDYDGYIKPEDIARYFQNESNRIDFNVLKHLIMHKDRSKRGKLDYTDFSKWLGSSIEPSAGFWFRHDSIKNPQYELNLEKVIKKHANSSNVVREKMTAAIFETDFVEKVQFQWKTLKKAFTDLNTAKSGAINPNELESYLKNWGYYFTKDQFNTLFKRLDYDNDGKISYEDFQNSVGNEISPPEFLYFRQDLKPQKPLRCAYKHCWETTIGLGSYCALHTRIIYNRAFSWMVTLQTRLQEKWPEFYKKIESMLVSNEEKEVPIEEFTKLWTEYDISINENEWNILFEAFPGKVVHHHKYLDMSHLVELQKANDTNKIYNRVDLSDDDEEEMGDFSGYTGYRQNDTKFYEIYAYGQLIDLFVEEDKLPFILKSIKDIDQDNNGYVTTTELEDILKLHYPVIKQKNLKKIFKPFASIQNRILIDYVSGYLIIFQNRKLSERT